MHFFQGEPTLWEGMSDCGHVYRDTAIHFQTLLLQLMKEEIRGSLDK